MRHLLEHVRRIRTIAALIALLACTAPQPSRAGLGDCGQPMSNGPSPTSSDCLKILRVSVDLDDCEPPCICDVNATATVTTVDALVCLKKVVGQSVELDCLCLGQSTTTTGPTSTTSLSITTTTEPGPTTTIPTSTTTMIVADCPEQLDLSFASAVRGQCVTNDDCAVGSCDASLGRCVTATQLDLGWAGILHDADVNDSVHLLTSLHCTGTPGACGDCNIGSLDPSVGNCRCSNDNRKRCTQPFANDLEECNGEVCNCYLGPPLPVSAGTSSLCLMNRISREVSGSFNPDAGDLSFDLTLRTTLYTGQTAIAPCPSCGGRCLAPPVMLDVPCTRSSDCDSEEETGECGRFDQIAGDGVREGLCVGGPNAGFGCDVHGFNTTFPAPGGSGYSLDCFPAAVRNASGQGLAVPLRAATGAQSLESAVECGFPPISMRLCPCGVCGENTSEACSSNTDCEAEAVCTNVPGTASPNVCEDEVCTAGEGGEGACLGGPADHFCDELLRANGRGLLPCASNADCDASVLGVAAGSCVLEEARECFPATVTVSGHVDPRLPTTAAVACIAPTSNTGINAAIGLPGALRLQSDLLLTPYCQNRSSVYAAGQGCQ